MFSERSALKLSIGYVAAVVLALITANISTHVRIFEDAPLALSFLAVAGVTVFFGLGPGILCVLTTAAVFASRQLQFGRQPSSTRFIVRLTIILGVGLLIAYLFERQRNTTLRLQKTLRDLREEIEVRKGAEEALLRSEKLAAIGRLSSTIAHEINNPLESVTNLIYLASCDSSLSEETRAYVHTAQDELGRLASIARHTLTFARVKPQDGPTDVASVAAAVVSMFQPKCLARGGQILLSADGAATINVPAEELRQILTNLLSNACDAVPSNGGQIKVLVTEDAETVSVRVEDNGCGIPKELEGKIYDAFFSTKGDLGTGIGLWVIKELTTRHGGTIRMESNPEGKPFRTAFALTFPKV